MTEQLVNLGLWSSGLLMGLVGGPHCVAMCGAACSAIASRCGREQPGRALLAWQLGRAIAYSAAGAAVASSVGLLAQWGSELAWLRPWWLMLHVAALAVGAWMMWHGRAPAWLSAPFASEAAPAPSQNLAARPLAWAVVGLPTGRSIRDTGLGAAAADSRASSPRSPATRLQRSGWRAGLFGLGWVALPCGLLQAALLTAALASSAFDGAMVMASFALGSGLSLWFGPRLWITLTRWLPRGAGGPDAQRFGPVQATRLAGGMLAIAALWGLWHVALGPFGDVVCRAT